MKKQWPILTNGAPGSGIVKRAATRAAANDYHSEFSAAIDGKGFGLRD